MRLRALRREARIVVRTVYSPQVVAEFLGAPLDCAPLPPEPSLVMKGPLSVDRDGSAAAYRRFHEEWNENLSARVEALASLRPDLLVSNIPYASLAAAARLSIPALALCCLNWLDMRAAYCSGDDAIAETIDSAYQSAEAFLQPEPHMPMAYLRNARSIGPIGRKGVRRGEEIRAQLGLRSTQRLVLVTLGGVPGGHALKLADAPDIFWIVQGGLEICGRNAWAAADLKMPFIDIVSSVDAVLCKDGYSTLVEAACNGPRILMLTRADWPETPYFAAWAERNARFRALPYVSDATTLLVGLRELLAQEPAPLLEPTGVDQAVAAIAGIARL